MISENMRTVIKEIMTSNGFNECLLFGSYARGDENKFSDYDLMVISDSVKPGRERIRVSSFLRGLFAARGIDADIILKSHKEIEYYKNKTGHIVKHALLEGIQVW